MVDLIYHHYKRNFSILWQEKTRLILLDLSMTVLCSQSDLYLFRQADNIDAALGGYFMRENLGQGETMYKCEKCLQKVPATKQYKIERPPLVLCIQLKRFNMMGGKNGRPVTLSRKLNISNHVRLDLLISFP